MTSMTYLRRVKPTLSPRKFVGQVLTWEWIARSLIDFLHGLLAEDLPMEGFSLEGDLSDWIERLRERRFAVFVGGNSSWRGLKGPWQCCKLMWDFRQVNNAKELIHQAHKLLPAKDLEELEDCCKNRDFAGLDLRLQRTLKGIGPKWRFRVSEYLEMMRALQAAFRCIALYKANPIHLIERARTGDQDAALDLIKIDQLFLTDPCTQRVLRKAALDQDQEFSEKLAWAMEYKPEFTRRHALQVYFYGLFAFGIELPKICDLQLTLDPDGKEFPGDFAFERFVERRRNDIAFRALPGNS
jgi:hypothetical protein